MLDIKFIRENTVKVREAIKNKQLNDNLDHLLSLDDRRRKLIIETEAIRSRRNEISEKLKKGKDETLVSEGKQLKEQVSKLELELKEVEEAWLAEMYRVPNIPADDVPVGTSETENKVVFTWGKPKKFNFEPKDHMALAEKLNLIDTDSAARVTGSRFYYLLGGAASLQLALMKYVTDLLTDSEFVKQMADSVEPGYNPKPFIPVFTPVMIREDVYKKAARLTEADKDERYYLQQDNLYLIGSAEHTLVSMHMDKTFEEKDLPLRYIGYSTSFRREAGSYGKDVKGILRVHQFDKLEMESFSTADDSMKEHLLFVAIEEYLLQKLEIPYQKLLKCTADIGVPNARGVDLEAWMPGQNKYRETHTADLMTDYQSRRLNIRVKRKKGPELVHTNDATALAMPRTLIAILENYQQEDGSILVPEVLKPYTKFEKIG
ncbi:MAG TPA: serine--tRNA ligase [Verrucomicrobiae bacterium]|nr:serine--tRNA ligase [Verrucomicrobiae bacterium]